MMRSFTLAMLALLSAATLSGCWESEAEQKAKEQQEASEKFWNITPPDESQDEGFTP